MTERRAQRLSPVQRIMLRPDEAAASLGMSEGAFRQYVLPEVPVVRRGRLRLIRVTELERWAARQGTTIGDELR